MSVVITGMGCVTALGWSVEEFWSALISKKSGISNIESFDASDLPVSIAGEIKNFPAQDFFGPKRARQYSKYIHYGCGAAKLALEHSGLLDSNIDKTRVAVVVGTGMGGIEVFHENVIKSHTKGPKRISPFFIPMSIPNMQSGIIAIDYGFLGPNYSISTACATGNHCIINGAMLIESKMADVVIVGGSEASINLSGLGGFCAQKALSLSTDPTSASKPFDINRNGFVAGEGAGVLVLESEEHAKKRKANILARYLGGGMSSDAHHLTAPHPEGLGAARAMSLALSSAQLNPNQIDYINAHGTSTKLGDLAEVKAIHSVFKEDSSRVKVSSTKSMIGHSLGAAAAIEAIVAVQTIRDGKIHPTDNLENQDPECDLNVVTKDAYETNVDNVLSNSFGFGGHNASIILGKY
ncbi:MAG: beta-ketoacyl-ACP synthase II [Candidatus Cloacimonetes bacterium]|nr:beta-ketoacyl-ACP synthase II [Candidatus Cloacimonadota bacterium]